jgi:hypothetical protein
MTIIILASSYGTRSVIEQKRNRLSYCNEPIVHRWTTPSSSRWWWWRRSALAEFPPPIFAGFVSALVFLFFCGVLLPRCVADHFYRNFLGQNIDLEMMTDGWRCSWRGGEEVSWGPPGRLFRDLGLLSWGSTAPGPSLREILRLKKSQVNLTSFRFLKVKNTQNRVSYSAEL